MDVSAVQQSDDHVECRRAQVHVTLGGPEILMPREFLDRPRRCATHRQVRTEGVPDDVQSRFHIRSPGHSSHHHLHHLLRQWLALVIAEYARAAEMPPSLQGGYQTPCQRHVADSSAFRGCDVPPPVGPRDAQLALTEVDVSPLEPDHLSPAQTRLATEKNNQFRLRLSTGDLDEPLELVELIERRLGFRRAQHLDRTRDAIDDAPFDCGPHQHIQYRQYVVHGFGRPRAERRLEVLHIFGRDGRKRLVTQPGQEMQSQDGFLRRHSTRLKPVRLGVPFNEPWREFSQSCLWRFLGAIGWPFTSSQRSRAFTHRCAAFFAPVQRLFVKQHHGEEAKGRVDHQATATLSSMSDTATPSSGSAIQ